MLPYALRFFILSHLTDVKGMTQISEIMDMPQCLHCEYSNSSLLDSMRKDDCSHFYAASLRDSK